MMRRKSTSSVVPSKRHERSKSSVSAPPTLDLRAQDCYSGGNLLIEDGIIKDAFGRSVHLRGVNLCANSKLPTLNNEFQNHKTASFLNRPFPLIDAHEHFARLSHWGLTFVRLLVPWEALEHAGPGLYDEEYIEYLVCLCSLMPMYGIKCFVDPHQDVWSRFSGGSGAPGWTMETIGMNICNFKETMAAKLHHDDETMAWPANYAKLASSTMFTLFFGGQKFAPELMVQNQNIQCYLQKHFIQAFRYLASRLSHLDSVIGFEVINEPHHGYIGLENLNKFNETETLFLGEVPSALQSFCLGMGYPQFVDVWTKSWPMPFKKTSVVKLNESRTKVWKDGFSCPFYNKVYKVVEKNGEFLGEILKPKFFSHNENNIKYDFDQDFYQPFIKRYARAIQRVFPSSFIMMEPIPLRSPPLFTEKVKNLVYAPHWYELKSIFSKSFTGLITFNVPALRISKNIFSSIYFGLHGARQNFALQLKYLKKQGLKNVGATPCIIGECGIPMDMNEKYAFQTGNYKHHINFLDAVIHAMEVNNVHFTLWNYNPVNDNNNGDFWNGEDFSIFSAVQWRQSSSKVEEKRRKRAERIKQIVQKKDYTIGMDLELKAKLPSPTTPFEISEERHFLGGRVLDAVIRPYASRVPGTVISSFFDLKSLSFHLEFESHQVSFQHEDMNAAKQYKWHPNRLPIQCFEAVLFLPKYHYAYETIKITLSDGTYEYNKAAQTLIWKIKNCDPGTLHRIEIKIDKRKCCIFY